MVDRKYNLSDQAHPGRPTVAFGDFLEMLRGDLGSGEGDPTEDPSPRDLYQWAEGRSLTGDELVEKLSTFCGMPSVASIEAADVEFKILPKPYCQAKLIVPIKGSGARQTVVLSNPYDWELLDDLERTLPRGRELAILLASPRVLAQVLDSGPDVGVQGEDPRASRAGSTRTDGPDPGPRVYDPDNDPGRGQATAKLAIELLRRAVAEDATHLLIEPRGEEAGARANIEGRSYDLKAFSAETGKMLVARFKALAGMDLAKKRTPQHGGLHILLEDRVIKLRLSTVPTATFENLTVRVLDPAAEAAPLHDLGLSSGQADALRSLAHQEKGLVLFVGPLGSGKTTTIYSLLADVASEDRRVVTVEDPIEHKIPHAEQQEVTPEKGIRSLLQHGMHQKPDVLFLSEIRDLVSAQMCIEFIERGHLVFTTMNSSNAATAIFRLERLGLPRSTVADLLIGVVAQRLVERLCPDCREIRPPDDGERALLDPFTVHMPESVAHPVGCSACRGTGYVGQEGVFEVIPMGPRMADLIREARPIAELRDLAQARGDLLVADHGIRKIRELTLAVRDVYRAVLLEEAALDSEARDGEFGVVVPQAVEEGQEGEPSALAGSTILVVEDEEGTRFLLDQILAQAGYRVITAADGGEALLRLGGGSIDLILSDIHMPNLDGLKLLEIMNQHRMDVPVILLTGEPSPDVEARGLEMGVAAYMRKPIQRDTLLEKIEETLGPEPE